VGKIKAYGTATWNGYRVPSDSQDYLSLHDILKTAEKAGRGAHHFTAVQLPYNLGMAEAIALDNQVLGSQTVPFLQAAHANDIAVFTSASILQARLSKNLPPVIAKTFTGLETDAQRAIQFVRSSPGVTAALVGMKRKAHVEENLKVAKVPPVSPEKLKLLFSEGG
jgi:aryl-alcohol dehydrogenase-like predicted oxidoreductase